MNFWVHVPLMYTFFVQNNWGHKPDFWSGQTFIGLAGVDLIRSHQMLSLTHLFYLSTRVRKWVFLKTNKQAVQTDWAIYVVWCLFNSIFICWFLLRLKRGESFSLPWIKLYRLQNSTPVECLNPVFGEASKDLILWVTRLQRTKFDLWHLLTFARPGGCHHEKSPTMKMWGLTFELPCSKSAHILHLLMFAN